MAAPRGARRRLSCDGLEELPDGVQVWPPVQALERWTFSAFSRAWRLQLEVLYTGTGVENLYATGSGDLTPVCQP